MKEIYLEGWLFKGMRFQWAGALCMASNGQDRQGRRKMNLKDVIYGNLLMGYG